MSTSSNDSAARLAEVLDRCADKLAQYGEIGHVSLAKDALKRYHESGEADQPVTTQTQRISDGN